MVGNDIVDLNIALTNSKWSSPRFINKIFTASEKIDIEKSKNKFQTIWRLWSMKESAYKIYVQQSNKTFIDPKKIDTQIFSNSKGLAIIQNQKYFTITTITTSYIYTEAKAEKNEALFSALFTNDKLNKSNYCKAQLINYFAKTHQINPAFLEVKKNSLGVPKLFFKNKIQNNSISITHHGDYAAVCFN